MTEEKQRKKELFLVAELKTKQDKAARQDQAQ
jgi:hypothetical protein